MRRGDTGSEPRRRPPVPSAEGFVDQGAEPAPVPFGLVRVVDGVVGNAPAVARARIDLDRVVDAGPAHRFGEPRRLLRREAAVDRRDADVDAPAKGGGPQVRAVRRVGGEIAAVEAGGGDDPVGIGGGGRQRPPAAQAVADGQSPRRRPGGLQRGEEGGRVAFRGGLRRVPHQGHQGGAGRFLLESRRRIEGAVGPLPVEEIRQQDDEPEACEALGHGEQGRARPEGVHVEDGTATEGGTLGRAEQARGGRSVSGRHQDVVCGHVASERMQRVVLSHEKGRDALIVKLGQDAQYSRNRMQSSVRFAKGVPD